MLWDGRLRGQQGKSGAQVLVFLVSSAKTRRAAAPPGGSTAALHPLETHFITSPWEERHAHTETSPGNRRILLRVATATSEVVREERRSRRMDGWMLKKRRHAQKTNEWLRGEEQIG